MTNNQLPAQYSTGRSRHNIEQAFIGAGKDLNHLAPTDLGLLEDFHTMGRMATSRLVDLADITPETTVLDAGSGIGGTARYVADRIRCTVTAVDLTDQAAAIMQSPPTGWAGYIASSKTPDECHAIPSRFRGATVTHNWLGDLVRKP
jgi:SAM-dependent methyltransferase